MVRKRRRRRRRRSKRREDPDIPLRIQQTLVDQERDSCHASFSLGPHQRLHILKKHMCSFFASTSQSKMSEAVQQCLFFLLLNHPPFHGKNIQICIVASIRTKGS